ncbi:hypothetical protein HXX76_012347 [Chlamydomonas incerta]|uniref:Ribonucleases P/MRP subunit Pop8-like domain-containing protein n=1 Tax=Chlamydomonas incerta TaxID=51695 RepID=A0A835SKV2_CHLIN|nr:hypothetical protein HXX76_012347 [Chlamydomonas incerta]|eukprot:KAG2427411.1 hypothetical protein HXX76_012347 [Chlamydomonas incerta]
MQRQWTREVGCGDAFILITLEFPALGEAAASTMTEQLFKDVLTRALTDLYGVVGGAVPFTLLHLEGGAGIVRVARSDVDKLWAAASFATCYDQHELRLTPRRSSAFLLQLASDSRRWAEESLFAAGPVAAGQGKGA